LDIEGLLKSLNAHSVRYVVIGATAFPVHGYARATLDLDLFIEPTQENAALAREALLAFGYDLTDVSVEEMLTKKILIRQYTLETDLHPFVKGVSFAEVWARRIEDRIGETATSFASLDDLIQMKEAAGRPKDLEDLRVLRKLRASSEGR
jgi:predicted nucleotidyltransferase